MTLLFADLAGYTSLAASLDPEEVYAVVRPWMTALRLVVEDHGGTVPQVMGDGFMAVFGVPTAHEDDADRAVRAALALARRAGELKARRTGVAFPGLHVGVNTGEVMVAGSREASGFAVVGDPVNVTARLADLATAGQVLVGDATRALTAHTIRYGPRRVLSARGKPEPVPTYEALGARAPGTAVRRGRPSSGPFVDRVAVLRRLAAEAEAVRTSGRARVQVIVDEPGVGKTRLAEELRARLPGALVLFGACHPYGQRLPLAGLAEAVGEPLGIRPGMARERARQRVRRFVRDELGDAAGSVMEAQLETVLGLHGAGAIGATLDPRSAIRPVIRALARGRPAVVMLDDAHWADPDLLALLEDLHRAPWPEPVLFLALARPEPEDWYRGLPAIHLGALGPREARRILAGAVGGGLPPAVVRRLVERAAGNPLFLEESGRMLVESGALVRAGRAWAVADPSAIDRVPATLRLLIVARLDGLPPEEKRTLQEASIAGAVTWDGLVVRLADGSEAPGRASAVRAALRAFEGRDLLRRRPASQVRGAVELEFKHVVIRDVAYESLPRSERARRHRVAADWLRERIGEAAVAQLAHHYERAWELSRSPTQPTPDPAVAGLAAEYLRRWSDAVFAVQPRLAEAGYGRGLRIAEGEPDAVHPDVVAQLLIGRAESLAELGRHREAIDAAERARSLAAESGATETRGFALLALGRARSNLGDVVPARQLIEEALAFFESAGNTLGRARAFHRLAEACRFDDFTTEVRSYRRAYALYRRAGARPEQAIVAEDLAYILTVVGGRAFGRWFDRARRLVGRTGDERGRAALLRAWAYAAWYRGDLDDALRAAREARLPAAEAGDRWIEVDTVLVEALVRSVAGPPAEADRLVRQLIGIADAVGARHLRALALIAGAPAALRSGRPRSALRRLSAARRTLAELGVAMEMAEVDLAEAAIHLDRGAWDRVAAPATAGERRARANGWRLLVPLGPLLRGRAHLGAGRLAAARRELRRAARLARSLDAVGPLATAEAALAEVSLLSDADTGAAAAPPAGRSRPGAGLTFREAIAIGHETQGLRAFHDGDPTAAVAAFGRAVRAWSELGRTAWQARAERFRAAALEAIGRTAAARAAQRRSASILSALIERPTAVRGAGGS